MLRATVQIVPFGDEELRHDIFKLDIANVGDIRNEGFGHQICKYQYTFYRAGNEILDEEDWVEEYKGSIAEHDRRDGALELVRKVIEDLENPHD